VEQHHHIIPFSPKIATRTILHDIRNCAESRKRSPMKKKHHGVKILENRTKILNLLLCVRRRIACSTFSVENALMENFPI
jgi:hypothetical protein